MSAIDPADRAPAATPEAPGSTAGPPSVGSGARIPGLDGLRALAVTLVLLFHLSPGAVVGGYIGVDLFFVISGFLITALLLRERAETGRVSFRRFWLRRARRLLPALAVLLLLCTAAAWAVGGDLLIRLGTQLLGAVTFSSNWLLLATGTGYFDQASPELFRNLWSLGVEEQFYLVWPLLLVLVLLRMPAGLRIALVALLAVGSGVAMALLGQSGDPTRVYYGTDTHFFGLAIGALLALLSAHWPETALGWPRGLRRLMPVAGVLAIAGIVVAALLLPENADLTFRGGLFGVALLAAIAIAAVRVPASPLGRLLELAPLRFLGRRSYGLYLWHWPVWMLLLEAAPDLPRIGAAGWALGAGAAAVSLALASLSFRFVEEPVRRLGFRGAARALGHGMRTSRRTALAVMTASVLVVASGIAGTAAVLSDPGLSETQQLVQAGQQALDATGASPSPAPSGGMAAPGPAAPGSGAAPGPIAGAGASAITGAQMSAIGDSVMLAAAPTLQSAFPGIAIDAVVSRQLSAAPDLVSRMVADGTMRRVLVLALGTNGPITRSELDRVLTELGPQRELVVVNTQAPRSWEPGVNQALSDFAQYYRNVELADWHDAIQPSLGLLASDQIHFGSAGAAIFSGTIRDAVQRLTDLPPLRDTRADLVYPRPV